MPTHKPLDQVVIAVLANRLDSIVREMTNTLFRTGRSAILNTAKDFSCSIVTAENELLSSADGLPIHVLGGGRQTQSMQGAIGHLAWKRLIHRQHPGEQERHP